MPPVPSSPCLTEARLHVLRRTLAREADALPALGAQLRHAFSAGSVPIQTLMALAQAGHDLLDCCTCLCELLGASPAALLQHCRAAQLLHACGTQRLAQVAAEKGHGSAEHVASAQRQLESYSCVMNFVRDLRLAGKLPTQATAVTAALQPAPAVPWLAHVGEALLAGLERSPGERDLPDCIWLGAASLPAAQCCALAR